MTVPPCPSGLTSGGIVSFYRRNGIAFSSLTGRAGGLPNCLIITNIPHVTKSKRNRTAENTKPPSTCITCKKACRSVYLLGGKTRQYPLGGNTFSTTYKQEWTGPS